MLCKNCGTDNKPGVKACVACNFPLETPSTPTPAAAEPQPYAPAPKMRSSRNSLKPSQSKKACPECRYEVIMEADICPMCSYDFTTKQAPQAFKPASDTPFLSPKNQPPAPSAPTPPSNEPFLKPKDYTPPAQQVWQAPPQTPAKGDYREQVPAYRNPEPYQPEPSPQMRPDTGSPIPPPPRPEPVGSPASAPADPKPPLTPPVAPAPTHTTEPVPEMASATPLHPGDQPASGAPHTQEVPEPAATHHTTATPAQEPEPTIPPAPKTTHSPFRSQAPERSAFSGTIDPFRKDVPAVGVAFLQPVAKDGEKSSAPISITATDQPVEVNRSALDPDNNTITSKVQAAFEFRDGVWYIVDKSEQQTTFIRADQPVPLKKGDLILMGNRKFIFDC